MKLIGIWKNPSGITNLKPISKAAFLLLSSDYEKIKFIYFTWPKMVIKIKEVIFYKFIF